MNNQSVLGFGGSRRCHQIKRVEESHDVSFATLHQGILTKLLWFYLRKEFLEACGRQLPVNQAKHQLQLPMVGCYLLFSSPLFQIAIFLERS